MISIYILKLIVLFGFLESCDPGLNGDLKVYNQTDLILTVVTFNQYNSDSTTFTIQPNSHETIKVLGGLGNQKKFECCPCQLNNIKIKTINGIIKKDPNNKDNWNIPNHSSQRKYGGEDLKCEFYVTSADI